MVETRSRWGAPARLLAPARNERSTPSYSLLPLRPA